MLNSSWFLQRTTNLGIRCISGVPCSYVSALYSTLERDASWPFLSAASESEAVAIAAGAWLGGTQGLALCQNSGLGNTVNPLASLIAPFRIPIVLGVSRRGWPVQNDEPQHAVMGSITPDLLELLGLGVHMLPTDAAAAAAMIAAAECASRRLSTALVIEKNVFDNAETGSASDGPAPRAGRSAGAVERLVGGRPATRHDLLAACLEQPGNRATIATTGYTARELYALDDRDSHFYMVGSMGCANAIGVGLSVASGLPVTVLDGDGALLMGMGSMASIARHVRTPFLHVLLDNGQHESTGGQSTNASGVDFAGVAAACGYRRAWSAEGVDAVRTAIAASSSEVDGPVFVHCRIAPGTPAKLPRPTQALPALAQRMRDHISTIAATAAH